MSTAWILILFFGTPSSQSAGITAAEFSNEKACKSAIVSAQLSVSSVKAICVPKDIK